MGFKMKRKGFPMKSPMKSSSPFKYTVECPECSWSIEGTDPIDDQIALMDHISEAHLGGSTGPGTPGYIAPKDPWGTNWGDTPSTGGGVKAPEPKRN